MRLALGGVGLAILGMVLFPEFFMGVESGEWDTPRVIKFLIGFNMVLVATVLFIRPFQVWVMKSFAFRAMSPMSIIVLSMTQAAFLFAGLSVTFVVVAADWLGIDPTPGFGETRWFQLVAGISLLVATFLLHNKQMQRWGVRMFGRQVLGHLQSFVLLISRLLLVGVGVVSMFLAATAEWLHIDSSPGWGHDRTIQFCVGISLVVAGFILQNRGLTLWFMRHGGLRMISPLQITIMLIVRVLLTVAGVTVTLMVIFADVLGLDPSPGWGFPRTMKLMVGLALLFASLVLHNRPLWRWIQRAK